MSLPPRPSKRFSLWDVLIFPVVAFFLVAGTIRILDAFSQGEFPIVLPFFLLFLAGVVSYYAGI